LSRAEIDAGVAETNLGVAESDGTWQAAKHEAPGVVLALVLPDVVALVCGVAGAWAYTGPRSSAAHQGA